jgi:SAM-dependent methyltransferase
LSKKFKNYRELFKGEGAKSYSVLYEVNSTEDQLSKIENKLCLEMLTGAKPIQSFTHLDFACGTGRILGYFEKLSSKQIGLDISPDMLEIAKASSKAQLLLPDEYFKAFELLEAGDVVIISAFRFVLNSEQRDLDDFISFCKKILDTHENAYLMINNHGSKFSFRSLTLGVLLRRGNIMSEKKFKEKLIPLNFEVINKKDMQLLPTGIIDKMPWLFRLEKKIVEQKSFNFGINKIYFGKISK